jgi:DNA-binding CsgD family transcriptional regulator
MTATWTSSIAQIQTSNLDAAIIGCRRVYGDAAVTVDSDFRWTANVVTLGPVTLIQGAIDVHAQLTFTLHRHTLIVAREQAQHVTTKFHGRYSTNPGKTALLYSPGERIEIDLDAGLRARNMTFAPEFLEAQFAAMTGESIAGIHFQNGVDLQSPTGALINQVCLYVDHHLDRGGAPLPAALTSSLCETISRALLMGQAHNHSYLFDKPAPPSSRTIVRMVEEYLDAHASGPIVASDLADLTGAPMKSIDAAFQLHRQTTSLAFLRQRRLERARRLLLEDRSMPITQVAQMAGYLRIESFQDNYFKTFKETPLETRRRGFVGAASSARFSQHEPLPTPEARLSLLTDREKLICRLVVQGRLNKQIADELAIAERTVKHQRSLALKKLGVTSTVDLVKLWERLSK